VGIPLVKRRWVFFRAARNSGGFVTSDHPVNLLWSDSVDRGPLNSPGFGLRNTVVTFPLTTKLAIAGAFEFENDAREISEEMVAGFNGVTIISATRHIYARDLSFRYQLRESEPPRKAPRLVDDRDFGSNITIDDEDD
jgi:hypothetical protein